MQNQLCKVKSFEASLLYLIFLRTFTFAGLMKNNKDSIALESQRS